MLSLFRKLKSVTNRQQADSEENRYYNFQFDTKFSQSNDIFEELKKSSISMIEEANTLTKNIIIKLDLFKKRFDTVIENINSQVFVLNSERTIVEVNSSACSVFHLKKENILGQSFRSVVDNHPILSKLLEKLEPKIEQDGDESFREIVNLENKESKTKENYELISVPIHTDLGEEREIVLIIEKARKTNTQEIQ